METKTKSLHAFLGAKDFDVARHFYLDWGFMELRLSEKMSFFHNENHGFYLQDHYVRDWVENSMLFLEVDDLNTYWDTLRGKKLDEKYEGVKYVAPQDFDWGSEGYLYDPSGVLWHIGVFKK